jgi:Proteasome complex subunit Rpn13 ubiquitin receptor
LFQTDDQLLHFYWKDRKANIVEEDLIIFPEEAEMVHVPECETGRVYLLKFKSSSQKLFFWMQNANDEKDKENVDRVNKLINDLQSALNDQHGRSGRAEGDDDDSTADVLSLLGSSGQGKALQDGGWILVDWRFVKLIMLLYFFLRTRTDTRTNLSILTIGWRCRVSCKA